MTHKPRFAEPQAVGEVVAEPIAPGMHGQRYVKNWREGSACFGMDQTIFFDIDEADRTQNRQRIAAAKRVCMGCPVRVQCLDYALEIHEGFGIWGGLTPEERLGTRRSEVPDDGLPRCKNGHVLDESNVYKRKDGNPKCRACNREYMRKKR